MSSWYSFFNLADINEYLELYNMNVKDGLRNIRIERPNTNLTQELLDPVCTTPSMKADLVNLINDYNTEQSIIDCIFVYADDDKSTSISGGTPDGFLFVKKFNECVEPAKETISVEYFCTWKAKRGKVLLGYTVYTAIKRNAHLLLQIDQGYTNLAGYCLYTKLGFTVNPSLIPDCYKFNIHLIPMILQPPSDLSMLFNANIEQLCKPGTNISTLQKDLMSRFLEDVLKTNELSIKDAEEIRTYLASKKGGSRRRRGKKRYNTRKRSN